MIMDQPGGSRDYFSDENSEEVDTSTSSYDSSDADERNRQLIEAICFQRGLPTIIAECEARIVVFAQRRREERHAARAGCHCFYNSEDEYSESSEEYSYGNGEYTNDNDEYFDSYPIIFNASPITDGERRSILRQLYVNERSTFGVFLFIKSIRNGWTYEMLRNFFLNEYGLTCRRSVIPNDCNRKGGPFTAIIKFKTTKKLKQLIRRLGRRNIDNKFEFISFDKRPHMHSSSESSDDESRFGALIPAPPGFYVPYAD